MFDFNEAVRSTLQAIHIRDKDLLNFVDHLNKTQHFIGITYHPSVQSA
jgi:hypothetical protein